MRFREQRETGWSARDVESYGPGWGKSPLGLSTERPLDSRPLFVIDSNRFQSALPSKVERAHLALGSGGIDPLVASFDAPKLGGLMQDSKIDLILATSKHNVQYLLGGYRYEVMSSLVSAK